jgi:hypothetical protein
MIDRTNLNPVRTRRRRALHEKEVAGGAVWITLHHHRAVAQVREQHGRDFEVILNQVSLRDAQLRPEKLVEVGKLHDAITDFDVKSALVFWEFD